jgi:hypothetical protein
MATTPKYGANRAHPVALAPLDPNGKYDYIIDWTLWLDPVADTISVSTWIVPTGITGSNEAIINASKATRIWLEVANAALLGTKQTITNRITTAGGRIEDRSFEIRIEEK